MDKEVLYILLTKVFSKIHLTLTQLQIIMLEEMRIK